jgi:hypothetical protein
MAKTTKATPKTAKKRSTKYSKLAAVCSKELAAKKKALVLAEKRLAKAQKTHQELLAEVARLDMLERSLKAVNEGLEPPQNVRYVYSYPQWVWYGNPNGWYWNGSNYTYTLGNTYQGGSALCNSQVFNTVTTTPSTFSTAGNIQTSNGLVGQNSINLCSSTIGSSMISNDSGITMPASNSGYTLTSSSATPQWTTSNYTIGDANDGTLTIDLSTGALSDEAEEAVAAVAPEDDAVGVGNGD